MKKIYISPVVKFHKLVYTLSPIAGSPQDSIIKDYKGDVVENPIEIDNGDDDEEVEP